MSVCVDSAQRCDRKLVKYNNDYNFVCDKHAINNEQPFCTLTNHIKEKLKTKYEEAKKITESTQEEVYIYLQYATANSADVYAVISKILCFFYEYEQNVINYTKLSCRISCVTSNQKDALYKLKKYYNEIKRKNIEHFVCKKNNEKLDIDKLISFVKTNDQSTLQRRNLNDNTTEDQNITLYHYGENDIAAIIFDIFTLPIKIEKTKKNQMLLLVLPIDTNNDSNTAAEQFYCHIYKAIKNYISCDLSFYFSYICKKTLHVRSKSIHIANNTFQCEANWIKHSLCYYYYQTSCICNNSKTRYKQSNKSEIIFDWYSIDALFTLRKHYVSAINSLYNDSNTKNIKQAKSYYVFNFKNASLCKVKIFCVDNIIDSTDKYKNIYKRSYFYQCDTEDKLNMESLKYLFSYTYCEEQIFHVDNLSKVYNFFDHILLSNNDYFTLHKNSTYDSYSFLTSIKYRFAFEPTYKITYKYTTKAIINRCTTFINNLIAAGFTVFYLKYNETSLNTMYDNNILIDYDCITINPEKWCEITQNCVLHKHLVTKTPVLLRISKQVKKMEYNHIIKLQTKSYNEKDLKYQKRIYKHLHTLRSFHSASYNIDYNLVLQYIQNLPSNIVKLLIINENTRKTYLRHVCLCILLHIKCKRTMNKLFTLSTISRIIKSDEINNNAHINMPINMHIHTLANKKHLDNKTIKKEANATSHFYNKQTIRIIDTWNTCIADDFKYKIMLFDEFYNVFLAKFPLSKKMMQEYEKLEKLFNEIIDFKKMYYYSKTNNEATILVEIFAEEYYVQDCCLVQIVDAVDNAFSNK
ncbi:hypothetical protein BDAP_002814 [Binucleata daphniae]